MPNAESVIQTSSQESYQIKIRFLHFGRCHNSYDLYTVRVFASNGEQAGTVDFHVTQEGEKLYAVEKGLFVKEEYRRKGLATAMYEEFKKLINCTIRRDRIQSDNCKAFWDQPNRNWGK